MFTLLRHPKIGEPSCSKLVKALAKKGINLQKTSYYAEQFQDTKVLIRWGVTDPFPLKVGASTINSIASILLGVNKSATRMALQNAGVFVPKTWVSKDAKDITFPVIGRPQYHTQGKNVEFITNPQQLRVSTSAYWSEYLDKEKEYRVYVFGNKCLGVVEKVPVNKADIAWNSHLGAMFVDCEIGEVPTELVTEAVNAANVIGQHFSGVDLMWYKGKPYVLELNSSLALSNPHRVEIFAEAFASYLQGQG